jgi:predicted CXXCH cytochrome family protein
VSKRRVLLLAVVAAPVLLAIFFVGRGWLGNRSNPAPPSAETASVSPDDPRLTFPTPYRNVRPEVKYVGDPACAGCHAGLAKTYRDHPMGRSLAAVADATPTERYDEAARNPFAVTGLRYQVERRGDHWWHKELLTDPQGRVVAETAAEVQFAVGSGRSGRAYLVNRAGYLFSSPITWYPPKGVWDLSPGYDKVNPHFDRPITPDCLFCHSNRAEPVAHTLNRYRPPVFHGQAIGCERCHGPGELHVQRHQRGEAVAGVDDTIVNPARLEHALREAVCQQCHLQGQQRVWRRGRDTFDYRPGLPFHLFMSEFVKPPEQSGGFKFVGTVEQMYASRCFQESRGKDKMGCVSCHDPHAVPAPDQKAAFYRRRCLNCHTDGRADAGGPRGKGCSLPAADRQAKADNCVTCHMPKTGSNVNHVAITDHRVPRLPDRPRPPEDWPRPGRVPLVHFHRDLTGPDPEVERDRAIALVQLADSQPGGDVGRWLTEMALPLLESALERDEADLPAWEAKGSALWFQGRLDDANACFQKVLRTAPEREQSLFLAATLALGQRRVEAARGYAERLLAVNPWRWRYHLTLAQAQGQGNNWGAAVSACREALKLNPADPATRQLLVLGHLRSGDRAQAEREFDLLLALNPSRSEGLRRWFAEEMRKAGR